MKLYAAVLALIVIVQPLSSQTTHTLAAVRDGTQLNALPFEFHGLVQAWFITDDSLSTFRVRRAELKAAGAIVENWRWMVQIDPSKTNVSSILQDAMLTFVARPNVLIDAGQFKLPVGREGLQSSSTLETIERGLLAGGRNKFGDVRGMGAQVRLTLPRALQLNAGVFNTIADHVNRLDANHDKAVLGRIAIPITKSLSLGGTAGSIVGADSAAGDGNRLGADLLLKLGRSTLKGEYLRGEDGAVTREGYFGVAAYRISERVELAARYDVWDPDLGRDIDIATARETDYVAGINYFISGNAAKLQLNYLRKTFESDAVPSQDVVIINMQAAW